MGVIFYSNVGVQSGLVKASEGVSVPAVCEARLSDLFMVPHMLLLYINLFAAFYNSVEGCPNRYFIVNFNY